MSELCERCNEEADYAARGVFLCEGHALDAVAGDIQVDPSVREALRDMFREDE